MDKQTRELARRIAAELVLRPRDERGDAYGDEYLKSVSQCDLWQRLRCAHCDCHKSEGLDHD